MTYSITPQLHTSALLPSYVLPRVAEITSGARYAGVPTFDPGADWNFSSCRARRARVSGQGARRRPARARAAPAQRPVESSLLA